MNAICVKCGRHRKFRLLPGMKMDRICECGGVIVKARLADVFEFHARYEPVNLTARRKLMKSLAAVSTH